MRIRTQLAVVLSAVAAASFAACAALAVVAAGRIANEIFALHQAKQAEMLAQVARLCLERKDQSLLAEAMGAMSLYPGVQYAYLVGKDGRIALHPRREFLGRTVEEWRASGLAPDAFEIESPVAVGGDPRAAVVRVGYSRGLIRYLRVAASDAVTPPFAALALLAVALSAGAGALLAFMITRPLERLAEAAQAVGRGDLAVSVEESSGDEVGELGRRFNSMVGRLRELDELKDEFVSSVSHDLRSPLAAIRMYVDYILNLDRDRERLTPRHREMLGRVMDNAGRLGVFVSNILDAAKIKAGRMEYHLEPVALEPVAANLLDLYGALAAERKVALRSEVPADLPRLQADRQCLEAALSNLLSNALKFTGAGGRVSLGARAAGGKAEIFVEDTGRGITPGELPRIFERFGQAETAEQKRRGMRGTGLGLYVVKRSVSAMGGDVGLRSEPGRGTRVTLTLPLASAGGSDGGA